PSRTQLVKPGMSSPPVSSRIFVCTKSCALRMASFTAARVRVSIISLSAPSTISGSIVIDTTSIFPVITTVTMPPPAAASTRSSPSCSLSISILPLSSMACFTIPPKLPRLPSPFGSTVVLSGKTRSVKKSIVKDLASILAVSSSCNRSNCLIINRSERDTLPQLRNRSERGVSLGWQNRLLFNWGGGPDEAIDEGAKNGDEGDGRAIPALVEEGERGDFGAVGG